MTNQFLLPITAAGRLGVNRRFAALAEQPGKRLRHACVFGWGLEPILKGGSCVFVDGLEKSDGGYFSLARIFLRMFNH